MDTQTLPTLAECAEVVGNHDFFLGSGRDREGYRKPGSRWVYKLAKYPSEGVNEREFESYVRVKDSLPEGLHLPEMHLLENGVLAAEFIPGDRPKRCDWRDHDEHTEDNDCWQNIVSAFACEHGFYDSSAQCNVRVTDDGKVYIIDLGE